MGDIPELREPADPAAAAVRAAVPVVLNGRIDPAGDEDRFILAVTPGQGCGSRSTPPTYGSALDGVLQVLGGKGESSPPPTTRRLRRARAKARRPPPITSPDPSLDFTVPGGPERDHAALRDLEARGGLGFPYRIRVVRRSAGFELA